MEEPEQSRHEEQIKEQIKQEQPQSQDPQENLEKNPNQEQDPPKVEVEKPEVRKFRLKPNFKPIKIGKINWGNKNVWLAIGIIVALAAIVILAVYIRTQNIPQLKDVTTGQYTLGPDLDPFLFLRHSQEITEGKLQDPDMMRYAPVGIENYAKTSLMPWAIVFFYRFFALESIEFAAVIAPVIFFALTLIIFFLFIKKLFSFVTDRRKALLIALIATALYAVIPPMLHRTTAGIPELESFGMLWFWSAFYFFTAAWQESKIKKQTIFGVLAGIFTGLMTLTWGGNRYIFMTFALVSFIAFFFNKQKKKNFYIYLAWLIPALIFALIEIPKLGLVLTRIPDTGFAFMIFIVLFIDRLIFNTRLKSIKEKIKLPESIISLIVAIVIVIIALALINPGLISQTTGRLFNPFAQERVSQTVAENRAPYFVEWLGSFEPLSSWLASQGKNILNYPYLWFFFWLFFFGTLLFFYEATKHFNEKNKRLLNLFFIIFLLTFIFNRISPQSVLNGENFISSFLFFGGLSLFALVILCVYINAHIKKDEKTLEDFENMNFSYLLILAFIFWMVLSMRGAIRFFFIISPAFIIASAFLPFKLYENNLKTKDSLYKMLLWCAVIVAAIFLIITFINYTKATNQAAKWTVPSTYNQQWQKAMEWTRENTAEDAIFTHWWDYGYWVQTLGKRPTVLDGSNMIKYWNHLFGRYVLTAQNEKTALQFCKAHNVSYLLIDSTDIGKYPAYSSIGSDETAKDKLSWISTFVLEEKETQELRNGTKYVYVGGTTLDEDIVWQGQIFPQNKAGIGAFYLTVDEDEQINSADAIFVYNGKPSTIPIKYVYFNGELIDVAEEKEAINSILYIFPRLTQGLNEKGAAMYLSERAMGAQWVRLYLLDETENFELVHSEQAIYIQQLRDNFNVSVGDFLLAREFLGPIKIWKVNYPEDIPYHEEYLEILPLEENFAKLDHLGV